MATTYITLAITHPDTDNAPSVTDNTISMVRDADIAWTHVETVETTEGDVLLHGSDQASEIVTVHPSLAIDQSMLATCASINSNAVTGNPSGTGTARVLAMNPDGHLVVEYTVTADVDYYSALDDPFAAVVWA